MRDLCMMQLVRCSRARIVRLSIQVQYWTRVSRTMERASLSCEPGVQSERLLQAEQWLLPGLLVGMLVGSRVYLLANGTGSGVQLVGRGREAAETRDDLGRSSIEGRQHKVT
uniref:Uncharacterized protein n=1 Tax=Haptolina ericina TaxID=156174 RepID=A0A7S3ETA3_9EUKA